MAGNDLPGAAARRLGLKLPPLGSRSRSRRASCLCSAAALLRLPLSPPSPSPPPTLAPAEKSKVGRGDRANGDLGDIAPCIDIGTCAMLRLLSAKSNPPVLLRLRLRLRLLLLPRSGDDPAVDAPPPPPPPHAAAPLLSPGGPLVSSCMNAAAMLGIEVPQDPRDIRLLRSYRSDCDDCDDCDRRTLTAPTPSSGDSPPR